MLRNIPQFTTEHSMYYTLNAAKREYDLEYREDSFSHWMQKWFYGAYDKDYNFLGFKKTDKPYTGNHWEV